MQGSHRLITTIILGLLSPNLYASNSPDSQHMREDKVHIRTWNQFADRLLQLHRLQIANTAVETTQSLGGYAGMKDFYKEVVYIDKKSGKVLSTVQWVTEHPDVMHTISVNIYDDKGRLIRDYLAAYLPIHRNAPIQTLINIHHYNGGLHAFRQFDASGNKIYEKCSGRFANKKVDLSLWEDDFYRKNNPVFDTKIYHACFDKIPEQSDRFSNPLVDAPHKNGLGFELTPMDVTPDIDRVQIEQYVKELDTRIAKEPANDELYVHRGAAYFILHEFDSAIADYNKAIKIKPDNAMAYFGRGMARGRTGNISEGIEDISVYIKSHPDNSRALTKRGVRYIWLGELEKAEQDLSKAIALDENNAEANDDLGVIYAQRGDLKQAIRHFSTTIKLDPTYQKGHHNLAMALYMDGNRKQALTSIDQALKLNPNEKNSLLLKAEILDSLGKSKEAKTIRNTAEFLPDGNWSEQFSAQ